MKFSHMSSDKYLGQVLSANGKNSKNIEKMKNKGILIQNKIIQMLETLPGGSSIFKLQ